MPNEFGGYTLRTVAEDPELVARAQDLVDTVWPRFVTETGPPAGHDMPVDWMGINRRWPQLQFALLEPETDALVVTANMLMLAWDGDAADLPNTGWNWAMYQGALDHAAGATPGIACALSVTVDPAHQGHGLSRLAIQVMRMFAGEAGVTRLIAPVRPTWKARYPITPIADYCRWMNGDGLPFDPWLRVHVRLGATIVKPCERSMLMAGSVAEWEEWLRLTLPASGDYVAPGLLAPLHVDRARDACLYVEPNVWVEHRLSSR